MKIFFDESGNSGQNLLDKEQPVYVLVSLDYNDEETAEILKPIENFGKEIHFTRLRKYPKYQNQLKECFNNNLIDYSRIKILYYHKKFALCTHLVDQLVETVYFHKGIPFYKNGFNIFYANSLYCYLLTSKSKKRYEELLVLFQKMIREKTEVSIEDFYKCLDNLYSKTSKAERNMLTAIVKSKEHISSIMESIDKYTIDLALPSLVLSADIWGKQKNKMLEIIHDDSKQIEFWRDMINLVSNQEKERIEVGYDIRKMTFPLQIESINLVSSENVKQIQLADLLGSAFAYYAKHKLINNNDDKVAEIISNSKLAKIEVHPLVPTLDKMPNELGFIDDGKGINPLDYLAENYLL